MRKLTTEEFIEKAKVVHGDTYGYLNVAYEKSSEKININCKIHYSFWQTPSNHLKGKGCPKCRYIKSANNQKSNTKEFISKAKVVHGDSYDYSNVDYYSAHKKVKIYCFKHNFFKQNPANHLQGQGCPKCGIITRGYNSRNTTIEFMAKAKEIHGVSYDYSKTEYQGAHKKIILICKKHGDFEQTPNSHLRGHGCVECSFIRKRDKFISNIKEFITKAKVIHGDKYDYSKVEYKGAKKILVIHCKLHGDFTQQASSHLRGSGCPKCRSSKGERTIRNYLELHDISYEEQKKLKGCRNKLPLSFDFYLPNHNMLIEYQGAQHYKAVKHFGGQNKFKQQQKHDQIKRDFAKENGIKLLEISYTSYKDIEKILSDKL